MKQLAAIVWVLAAATLVGCSVQEDAQTTLQVGEAEQLVSISLSGMT